jgi:hypothetical protein
LHPTYPKRALGLVKHGRARFIDEHTIELTRPPEPQGEEMSMQTPPQPHEHSTTATATAPISGITEPVRSQTQPMRELAASDILQRIDMLISETAYLREGMDALGNIESSGPGDPHSPGDIGTQAKAVAISQVIGHREQTNQKLIALLDRMYDDLSPTTMAQQESRSPDQSKLLERLIDQ